MTAAARILAALLLTAPACAAQQLDCTNPTSQVEMTGCASQAWEAADAALNAAWGPAMERARALDEGGPSGAVPAATLLRDAQRAWIAFRDAACDAEATKARGGTAQNMLFYICLERLTLRRTEDLKTYASEY